MSGRKLLILAVLLLCCTAGVWSAPVLRPPSGCWRDAGGTAPLQGNITVRPNTRLGKIDPNIYGHFAELVFRVFYGGLWAEMLEARKFEGRDGEYGVIRPWYSIGRTPRTHFMHDNTTFYSGGQSQKIVSRDAPGHEAGVGQKGLYLEKGKSYEARINIRQEGIAAPLVVALEGKEGSYANRRLTLSGNGWQRFSFKLTSSETDRDGSFTLKLSGPGTLWIGTASLMPEGHLSGYRPDVIQALREIHVPNLRWPGGNFVSYYRWEDGIGDRDRRPSRLNLSRVIEGEGRYWEPNDVGTDEFLELCRLIGAQPYMAVNAGDGTPEEAARWLEYCNGPAGTPYGAKRAANGHRQPYRIKLWGIGNEVFGDWQGGHADEETHARRVVAFARAMRAVDPQIKLVAVGARSWFYPRWNQALFEIAKGSLDYLSLHSYAKKYRSRMKKEDLNDPAFAREFYYYIVSSPYGVEEQIRLTAEEIHQARPNGPRIPIAFDEWNCWAYRAPNRGYGDHEVEFAERDGLYTAGVFHAFRRQHQAVTLANFSMTVNALGLIRVNREGLFFNPQYLAFKMYMNHQGPFLVESRVEAPSFPAPEYEEGRPQAVGRIPYLDASATVSEDGRALYLAVINLHDSESIAAGIQIEGWEPGAAGRVIWLDADHYMTENTFEHPNRVQIKEEALSGVSRTMSRVFPPHSVTILEFQKQLSGQPSRDRKGASAAP
jgi:alpha-N-arabinofuranosidase